MKAARLHVLAVFGLPALVRTGQVVLAQGEEEQQKTKTEKNQHNRLLPVSYCSAEVLLLPKYLIGSSLTDRLYSEEDVHTHCTMDLRENSVFL